MRHSLLLLVTASAFLPACEGNAVPVAAIELNGTPIVGESLALDARDSHDPDGQSLSFRWWVAVRPEGSAAEVTPVSEGLATFVPDAPGRYEFIVRVSDGEAESAPARADVEVTAANRPAVPQIGFAPDTPVVGHAVELDGAGSSDPEGGPITYAWEVETPEGSQSSVAEPTARRTSFVPDRSGTYRGRLTVTDAQGSGTAAEVAISVRVNQAPRGAIRVGGVTMVGVPMTLDGQLSYDPDGHPLTYAWWIEDPTGATTTASGQVVQFVPQVAGGWRATLRVSDGFDSSEGSTDFSVFPQSTPEAEVVITSGLRRFGDAWVAFTGGPVVLDATGSRDGTSQHFESVVWTVIQRPAGSRAEAVKTSPLVAEVVPDLEGKYEVSITVRDAEGMSASAAAAFTARSLNVAHELEVAPDAVAYSEALESLVIVGGSKLVRVDLRTGLSNAISLPQTARSLALAPEGRTAVVGHDTMLSVVDLDAAAVTATHAVALDGAAIATDGTMAWAAAASLSGTVLGVQLADGTVTAHTAFAARPDDLHLQPGGGALYGTDGSLFRWELVDGVPTRETRYASGSFCGAMWFDASGTGVFSKCGRVYRLDDDPTLMPSYDGALPGGAVQALDHHGAAGRVAAVHMVGYTGDGRLTVYEDQALFALAEVALPQLLAFGGLRAPATFWVFFDAGGDRIHVVMGDSSAGGWASYAGADLQRIY